MLLGSSYIFMRLIWILYEKENRLSFIDSLHYVLFAPSLPTGPIQSIADYKKSRIKIISLKDSIPDLGRIGWGFFKVIILSSYIAPYALDFDNVNIFKFYQLNILLSLCLYM